MDFNAMVAEAKCNTAGGGGVGASGRVGGGGGGGGGSRAGGDVRGFWGLKDGAKKQKIAGGGRNIVVVGSDREGDARTDRMHNILPGLWLGEMEAAEDIDTLVEKGITHLVSLIGHKPPHESEEFDYLVIHAQDLSTFPIKKHFAEAISFIKEAHETEDGGVLVYCAAGMSRSPTIVIAYLMAEKRMSFTDAYALVRERRSIACPNEGFRVQLLEFEKALRVHQALTKKGEDDQGVTDADGRDSSLLQHEVWALRDHVAALEKDLQLARKKHEDFVMELWEEDYPVERKMRMIGEEHKRIRADRERLRAEKERREKEEREHKERAERERRERAERRVAARREREARNARIAKKKQQEDEEEEAPEGKGKEKEVYNTGWGGGSGGGEKEEVGEERSSAADDQPGRGFVPFSGEGRRLAD